MTLVRFVFSVLAVFLISGFAGDAKASTADCRSGGCRAIGSSNAWQATTNRYARVYRMGHGSSGSASTWDRIGEQIKRSKLELDARIGKDCGGRLFCVEFEGEAENSRVRWPIAFGEIPFHKIEEWHVDHVAVSPARRVGWVTRQPGAGPAVPEPGAALLFGAGLLVVGRAAQRRSPAV